MEVKESRKKKYILFIWQLPSTGWSLAAAAAAKTAKEKKVKMGSRSCSFRVGKWAPIFILIFALLYLFFFFFFLLTLLLWAVKEFIGLSWREREQIYYRKRCNGPTVTLYQWLLYYDTCLYFQVTIYFFEFSSFSF